MPTVSDSTPPTRSVESISPATLQSEIGRPAARSALRGWWFLGRAKIPDHEYLRVGDVILSRDRRYNPFGAQIRRAQLREGCPAGFADYSHAMLYVGELHVVESAKRWSVKTG